MVTLTSVAKPASASSIEHTTIHEAGVPLPSGMDGVGGLTQKQIPVGQTYVYEFVMKKSGTFMYHPTPTRWCRWRWA